MRVMREALSIMHSVFPSYFAFAALEFGRSESHSYDLWRGSFGVFDGAMGYLCDGHLRRYRYSGSEVLCAELYPKEDFRASPRTMPLSFGVEADVGELRWMRDAEIYGSRRLERSALRVIRDYRWLRPAVATVFWLAEKIGFKMLRLFPVVLRDERGPIVNNHVFCGVEYCSTDDPPIRLLVVFHVWRTLPLHYVERTLARAEINVRRTKSALGGGVLSPNMRLGQVLGDAGA